ncbi:MAG: PLP-dependent aminotransferase family protein [Clostridiales bacterium]|nr:PLP-dependent aminotransferase family protein [Clostridiales bacterium]
MNIQIDKEQTEPAYIQLYHYFVRDIVSGIYPYGTKLPSKRVIADETGVSVITVEHMLTLLAEEGYVQSRQRSGVFVIYKGEDFLGQDILRTESIVLEKDEQPIDYGEFPFSVLARTMRKVILDHAENILVKSPNHGCAELRNEICLYLGRSRGITVEPSQIIVGSGSEYLYGLIAQLLAVGKDPGYIYDDSVCDSDREEKELLFAIEDPSYKKIRLVYETMGIVCDPLPMTPDGISSESLKKTKARVLHVTPFHSFPSGVTVGISKKMEYLRWAKKRRGILIEDNYDSELTVSKKAEEPIFSMDPDVDVIYLNTFSRTLAPSMRIGYMILPLRLVKPFEEKLGFYSCTVPIFEQYVLAELLRSGDFERHVNRVRRKRRK